MKINFKIILIISLVSSALFIGATYEEILGDKSKQIEIFKKEIEDSKNQIKINKSDIEDIHRQSDSLAGELDELNNFLKDYENDKFLSPDEIASETDQVLFLEDQVPKLQDSFKNKIINLYKHGKNYELELLLSSRTPNEYLRRNEYLQKFSQDRKKKFDELKSKKYMLDEKKKMLALSTSSKRIYIELKRNEKSALEDKMKDYLKAKNEDESQITAYENRIPYKEQQIQIVQNFINNFIANKQNFSGNKYSRINYASDDFSQLKGSLNLPVDLGIIRNNFGDYYSIETNTHVPNNGIDFNIAIGSRVFAVANGTVTLIGEVPYYGKIIIITHDNDYRSIYAAVTDISVSTGDKVHVNQVIAKSGETLDGQGIHFEIWQDKTPQNPKEWIRFQ